MDLSHTGYKEMEGHVLRIMAGGHVMSTDEVYRAIERSGILVEGDYTRIPTTSSYKVLKDKGYVVRNMTWKEKEVLLDCFDLSYEIHWKNNVRYAFRAMKKPEVDLIEDVGIGQVRLTPKGRRLAETTFGKSFEYPSADESFDGSPGLSIAADSAGQEPYVLTTIRQRRGQRKFRDALRFRYRDRCVFSGCDVIDVLEAAHIIPFHQIQSQDPENGLLLRADLHTLFDLDLIGIDPVSLTIRLKNVLALYGEYASLDGRQLFQDGSPAPRLGALQARWWEFQRRSGG